MSENDKVLPFEVIKNENSVNDLRELCREMIDRIDSGELPFRQGAVVLYRDMPDKTQIKVIGAGLDFVEMIAVLELGKNTLT